jgi:hypothetical protein
MEASAPPLSLIIIASRLRKGGKESAMVSHMTADCRLTSQIESNSASFAVQPSNLLCLAILPGFKIIPGRLEIDNCLNECAVVRFAFVSPCQQSSGRKVCENSMSKVDNYEEEPLRNASMMLKVTSNHALLGSKCLDGILWKLAGS